MRCNQRIVRVNWDDSLGDHLLLALCITNGHAKRHVLAVARWRENKDEQCPSKPRPPITATTPPRTQTITAINAAPRQSASPTLQPDHSAAEWSRVAIRTTDKRAHLLHILYHTDRKQA